MTPTRFKTKIDRVAQSADILLKYGEKLLIIDRITEANVAPRLAHLRVFLEAAGDDAFLPLPMEKAQEYRAYLHEEVAEGTIVLSTMAMRLTEMKHFVEWMLKRREYRDDIDPDVERLFQMDARTRNAISTAHEYLPIPTLEEVHKMVNSLIENQPEQRKAGAAFRLLVATGMRLKAIQTMQLKHFDIDRGIACQRPLDGQEGKFSKTITMPLIGHMPGLLEPVQNWKRYLMEEQGFKENDPLFPTLGGKTLMNFEEAETFVYLKEAPRSGKWLEGVAKAVAKGAGVRYYSPHRYRNFIARYLARRCLLPVQFAAVATALGHENLDTTFSYLKVEPQQAVDIVKFLVDDNTAVTMPEPAEVAGMDSVQREELLLRLLAVYGSLQAIVNW